MDELKLIVVGVGFLTQTVALITTAVKTGSWKGITDGRVETLEDQAAEFKRQVEQLDKRVDANEKDIREIMTKVELSLTYIKDSIDEMKKDWGGRRA